MQRLPSDSDVISALPRREGVLATGFMGFIAYTPIRLHGAPVRISSTRRYVGYV
jgi:hypothetical protein